MGIRLQTNMPPLEVINLLMKEILTLGQCSIPEHQYKAYRELVLDYFAEGRRAFRQGLVRW